MAAAPWDMGEERPKRPPDRSSGTPLVLEKKGVVFLEDDSFLLTVTGTDASGNIATDTDEATSVREAAAGTGVSGCQRAGSDSWPV